MTNPEKFKEKFYNNPREVLWRVPCTDKLIIAADFNARVGKVDKWPCLIGPRGVSKCNSNSELPQGLSSEHNLVITNTIFKRKKHHKTTWMQPRLLDYVAVRQVDQNDILNTRPISGADCLTNHVLAGQNWLVLDEIYSSTKGKWSLKGRGQRLKNCSR